jgi:phage terminase Nu1 subunit (DNA packaging protein)
VVVAQDRVEFLEQELKVVRGELRVVCSDLSVARNDLTQARNEVKELRREVMTSFTTNATFEAWVRGRLAAHDDSFLSMSANN